MGFSLPGGSTRSARANREKGARAKLTSHTEARTRVFQASPYLWITPQIEKGPRCWSRALPGSPAVRGDQAIGGYSRSPRTLASPQLAKADMRALTRDSGYDRCCCKSPKLPGDSFHAIGQSDRRPTICVDSITLPRSPVSLSSGDEVPPHLYTKVAPTARRIFDHQCKKTFATKSVIYRTFVIAILRCE
jgi:hypothetical protein